MIFVARMRTLGEGDVFSPVCSQGSSLSQSITKILKVICMTSCLLTTWDSPQTCSNLFTWRRVYLGTPIYWQAGGWPSTSSPSCTGCYFSDDNLHDDFSDLFVLWRVLLFQKRSK